LGTSTPWDAVPPDGAWQAECESGIIDAVDSSSDTSEQQPECLDFTSNSNFSWPPSVVTGDGMHNTFTSKNPNLRYQAHLRINGEILFIPKISLANFVNQENLVNKMAAA